MCCLIGEVVCGVYRKVKGVKDSDIDSGLGSMQQQMKRGPIGKGHIVGAVHDDPIESGMTKKQVAAYRAGKRRDGEYSTLLHACACTYLILFLCYHCSNKGISIDRLLIHIAQPL